MNTMAFIPNLVALKRLAEMARKAFGVNKPVNLTWQPLYEVLTFTSGAAISSKYFQTAANTDNQGTGNYEQASAQPAGKHFICTGIGIGVGGDAVHAGMLVLQRNGYFRLVVNNKKVYDNRLAGMPDVGGGVGVQSIAVAADAPVWGGGAQAAERATLPCPVFIRAQEQFYAEVTSSGVAVTSATGNWIAVTLFGFRTEFANLPGAL